MNPLKDIIGDSIPLYQRRKWSQRVCTNKCTYSIYRIFKTLFVSIWFYYAPFIALLMTFISPAIFAEKKELSTDGSSMGADY